MNEDAFNASIRKFLKTLGVTAQREIEKSVRKALEDGCLKGNEKLAAKATVTIGALNFTHEVGGDTDHVAGPVVHQRRCLQSRTAAVIPTSRTARSAIVVSSCQMLCCSSGNVSSSA